jgi:hypothetical protein
LSKADAVKKIFQLAAKRLGFEFSVVNPGESVILYTSPLFSLVVD